MKKLLPEEIRRAVRGRWRCPAGAVTIDGVSTDTRAARAGNLFLALRGPNFDGHNFLAQAAAAGCVAAVVQQDAPLEPDLLGRFAGGVIGAPDTTVALGDLAAYYRGQIPAAVLAVTGSNGKTTVKGMIHHILARRLRGSPSPKSFNNAVGVPLTLFAVSGEDDYVICEVGTSAPGEVAALARIVQPNLAVITSVSQTHLEKLIDVEHVAVEKAALLGGLKPDGLAVIWADSEPLARAVRAYDVRRVRFGQADDAELRLTGYEPIPGGGRFELNGRIRVDLAVPGRHNALNALAAIAAAQRFGFSQDEAAAALADYRGEEMRLELIRAGAVTIINDAYNANPASVRAGVDALASFAGARRVLVVGDMLELGAQTVPLHRATGAALAAAALDLIVGVGALGREIAAGAASGGHPAVETIESVEAAREALPRLLKGGDVVLLKGSRGMAMERLVAPVRAAFDMPHAQGQGRKAGRTC